MAKRLFYYTEKSKRLLYFSEFSIYLEKLFLLVIILLFIISLIIPYYSFYYSLLFLLILPITRLSKNKNLQKKKAEAAHSARYPFFSVTSPNTMLDLLIDYLLVTAFSYATPDPLTDYSLVTTSPYATPDLLPNVTF